GEVVPVEQCCVRPVSLWAQVDGYVRRTVRGVRLTIVLYSTHLDSGRDVRVHLPARLREVLTTEVDRQGDHGAVAICGGVVSQQPHSHSDRREGRAGLAEVDLDTRRRRLRDGGV